MRPRGRRFGSAAIERRHPLFAGAKTARLDIIEFLENSQIVCDPFVTVAPSSLQSTRTKSPLWSDAFALHAVDPRLPPLVAGLRKLSSEARPIAGLDPRRHHPIGQRSPTIPPSEPGAARTDRSDDRLPPPDPNSHEPG